MLDFYKIFTNIKTISDINAYISDYQSITPPHINFSKIYTAIAVKKNSSIVV